MSTTSCFEMPIQNSRWKIPPQNCSRSGRLAAVVFTVSVFPSRRTFHSMTCPGSMRENRLPPPSLSSSSPSISSRTSPTRRPASSAGLPGWIDLIDGNSRKSQSAGLPGSFRRMPPENDSPKPIHPRGILSEYCGDMSRPIEAVAVRSCASRFLMISIDRANSGEIAFPHSMSTLMQRDARLKCWLRLLYLQRLARFCPAGGRSD
jgi:hypothetical protein